MTFAMALSHVGATLDDLREAITKLQDVKRTARRVLGGEHPVTVTIEQNFGHVRDFLRAREATQPSA